jgi:hypothetical protein
MANDAASPPKVIWSEASLLRRAEEARITAEQLKDAECRRVMIGIAEGYETLARRARHWGAKPPSDAASFKK